LPRLSANHPTIWCLLALLLGPLAPPPVRAQYMYLDTNGDGQSTEEDVVSPTGTTVADVWLRTDRNRAGAAAVCPTEDGPMTINSYEFILRANGGTVSWGPITNRMPFPINLGTTTLGSDAHVGFGSGALLSPGTYRLATVAFSRLSGSPTIDIVPTTPIAGIYGTNFGSACSGNDFDNTLKLGSDWFDVDGASWGGTPNHPPVFAPIPTLMLTEGQTVSLPISASDADGEAIQFQKAAGPDYLTVSTINAAAGTGSLHASPSYLDAGIDSAVISASDGFRTSLASVRIEIADSPAPPALSDVGNMRVLAGGTADQLIQASDADGDAGQITFEKVSGPAFVNVGTLSIVSPSTARGQIHLSPSALDVGTASATVAAVKGTLRDEAVLQIGVLSEAPANRACVVSDMISVTMPNETTRNVPFSAQDPDGDVLSAHLVSGQSFASVEVLASSPGSLSGIIVLRPGSFDIGDHTITLGAYDGIAETRASFALHVLGSSVPRFTVLQDMSVGAELSATQTIWATSLDPDANFLTFSKASGPAYVSVQTQNSFPTYAYAVVTLRPSLADVGTATAEIAVSDGTHTTTAPMRMEVLPACPSMLVTPVVPLEGARQSLVGDIDGDQAADLLGFSSYTNDVVVRLGNGDGTFREVPPLVGLGGVISSLLTDLNGDRRADLVTAGGVNGGVLVRLALGGGAFGPPLATPISGYPHVPHALSAADMNSDARIDLIVGDGGIAPAVRVLLGAGDGTFALAGSAAVSSVLMTIATGDLNRDGQEDVVVGQYYNSSLLVIHGDGTGGFGTMDVYPDAGFSAHSVAVGDLNGDTWPDLVLAHDQLSVWFSDGTGSFPPAWQSQAPYRFWSVALGEVTGDGRNDIVATGEEWFDQSRGSCLVFPGIAADSLATPTGTIFDRHVIDASLADLDRDARLDLVATGQGAILAYFNHGCGPNGPPTANPGGPYAGTVGVPLSFDGSASSDPEGTPLTYSWDFGDGHQAHGAQVEHAYGSTGSYSVTLSVSDGELTGSATTTAAITAVLSARAFVLGPSRTTPLVLSDRPPLCIQLEPVGGAFRIEDLDPASLVMRSDRTGTVEQIGVLDSKPTVMSDRDHNGVEELTACFARADLMSLLGPLQGPTEVTLQIEGALGSGALVGATLELEVLPVGPLSARVYPNPMNPTSTLSLMLPRPGRLRATLFDVSGRSVRVLVDEPQAEAGVREIPINGKDQHGRPLATGIYLYRVESAGDVSTGQVVIVK
jgi:PKD repeat protein